MTKKPKLKEPRRPRVRSGYQSTGFFVEPLSIEERRRTKLLRRGVPEAVLAVIEYNVGILKSEIATKPPTKAQVLAALKALRIAASGLLGAWSKADVLTKSLLRHRSEILTPQPDLARGASQFEGDLDHLIAVIYQTECSVSRWPKPTGTETARHITTIVHRALVGAGLAFDTRPNGPAMQLLDALDVDGDLRHLIKQSLARAVKLGASFCA